VRDVLLEIVLNENYLTTIDAHLSIYRSGS